MSSASSKKSVRHMGIINKEDEYETPIDLFTSACVEFRIKPKLDVCANHYTAKCSNYFGFDQTMKKLQDAFENEWKMDFFCNPPYSQVGKFVERAIDQVWKHKVHGLLLTYAKTDTKWWHKFVEKNPRVKPHFIKGRIRFKLDGRTAPYSAPYPSVWLVIK